MGARDEECQDLSIYWRRCGRCNVSYHVAEPFCGCPDGTKDCGRCEEPFVDEDDDREYCNDCTPTEEE